jgi:hypothetical protein
VEKEPDEVFEEEAGLKEFLRNPSLSSDATDRELGFLQKLRFKGSRPTALYYYRELQNLRDPLNFRESSPAPLHIYGRAITAEKQSQPSTGERALQHRRETRGRKSPKKTKSKAAR